MTADTTWVELPNSRYPILFETGSLSHRASAPNRLNEFVGESVLIVSNQTIADKLVQAGRGAAHRYVIWSESGPSPDPGG